MFNLILTVAAAGVGYLLGSSGAKRSIKEQIDSRFAELQNNLQPGATVASPAPPVPAPAPKAAPVAAKPKPAPAVAEEISPEILAVISTAICAYLGKPARIRRVRRLPGGLNPWAQVGRVSVMASHALTRQH